MSYSRRNFLKAAGSGIVLTAVGGETALLTAATTSLPAAMTKEKAAFVINGKVHAAEYEARTTLWEVIAVKLGLTGTNRSCNRASCGACSVLVDGVPIYSCHTLATEAVGKKIFTIEGVGDEKNLHPLQRIGHTRVAADCGFCTAGWVVTAKALLDKNRNPTADQVKAALAGHICRCASYPGIIRTVLDSAAVMRGEKIKIEAEPESIIQIKQPMVRNFSTNGGHLPGDELIEGARKTVTRKWQGYPPENLNVLGKPLPPLPEVSIPRFTGKALYASRVWFPDMLYAKFLTCPHPHARIKNIETAAAEKMPGVRYILTYKNAPKQTSSASVSTVGRILSSGPAPTGFRAVPQALPQELNLQGEVVAIVAAETEDLAEDALDAIQVDYEVLPFASMLQDAMAADAPDLRGGKGNLLREANSPKDFPEATWADHQGDLEKGFAEADVVKEFTYRFVGGVSVPMQPSGSVAKWDGDKLTFWGMGQGIYPVRAVLAAALGMDESKIRFINKWNGSTFGSARLAAERFYPLIAQLAKETGRPVKVMLPKDQELAQLQIKPETITKFKVGAKKDGHITAIEHVVYVSVGDLESGGHASTPGNATNQLELYTSLVPHWRSLWCAYRTNAPRPGPSRSYYQQETKWSWENMMDEMAEAVGIDPVQFRLMHITRPKPGNPRYPYDSFPSVEVLEEGAKAFGWEKRNPVPGGMSGRFKRGFGVGMSQHHGGLMGYHEGEEAFPRLAAARGAAVFGTELELTADGFVTMKVALPDSGSNAATALAHLVAEMLGFTTRDRIRLIWGDTDMAPSSDEWFGGRTITLQGAAICSAADKLRKDLLQRAAGVLKVDSGKLQVRDGVISSTEDSKKTTTFAALVKTNGGAIQMTGRGVAGGERTGQNKGVGACFVEVEVDTWTGDWRFIRAVYPHDTGLVINPLVAEADMVGSLVESTQVATEAIPWDREFPGTRHYSVGYLSYRLPTIMDVPKQTQLYIDSLEPRWFYGVKSFSETSIGAVPGALANAIYNACGVRIREHPITREKIMAGLRAQGRRA
ncbi:MAG TPA: molybdopterin-dependent oxidoreductase [Bryobacteraceae bacterium]|jgi:CO/xanthine dehydrogenase Mo-binding subunit/aerobic-type carbon monoxide dehydrogenase small subunit (CoxS/CutS family)|nr:molybdopterin-dependent oxidoreductase [Bryobacteraceae bacterium]